MLNVVIPANRPVVPFDQSGEFRTLVNAEGLKPRAVRGAAVTMVCQVVAFVIQLAGSLVLARLLSPTDFGIVTMVTTFSLLFMNFGVNGFTEAILQRDTIDRSLASNVFWINVTVALFLTLGFALAGPLLAHFYGDARLAAIAVMISASILITSLSVSHLALLKRAMSFTAVAVNDVLGRAASVVVSVVLAWLSYGYWSLVAGAVAQPIALTAGAWILCRWIPDRPRRHAGTWPMVRFAVNTYGHFTTNYVTRNLDNLLVGWFFGPQALGFYKRAYDLTVLPVGQLSGPLQAVAMPTLSRLADDPERYRRYVLRSLSTVAFLGMGIGAAFAIIGKDLFLLLFGPKWQESGRLFTFFAPGMGSMMIYMTYSYIHLSIGKPDRLLRWGLAELIAMALMFFVGVKFGPTGVAVAWTASSWVLIVPALWYAGRPAGVRVADMIGACWRYALAGGVAAVITVVTVSAFPELAPMRGQWLAPLARSIISSGLFVTLYLGIVVALYNGLEPIRNLLGLFGNLIPGWRVSEPSRPEPPAVCTL